VGLYLLALLLLGFALQSNADDSEFVDLVACNTGNVEIDTVNVTPGGTDHRYTVLGWISVPPHKCANIFAEKSERAQAVCLERVAGVHPA